MSAVEQFMITDNDPGPVPLLIGLMGAPGAGKTFSALTLADGMRTPGLGKPVLIDTERGRSRKYRTAFDFRRIDFAPPFKPSRFLAAVRRAQDENPCAIIIDSISDEHEGEGGVLDWHEADLTRRAGDDYAARERMTQAAWIAPKAERRAMINGLLQIMTPLILCFRAREKTRPVKNERGKSVPTNIGFQPIAPLEIIHVLDLNILLPPKSDGRPQWKSDKMAEDFVMKLPEQFKPLFGTGQPITSKIGAELAAWARGDQASVTADDGAALRAAKHAAEEGRLAFTMHWQGLGRAERDKLKPNLAELEAIVKRGEEDGDPFADPSSIERQG